MTRATTNWLATGAACIALLSACTAGATGDAADVDAATASLLDAAELALPQITDDLDATIVQADRGIEQRGGMEGTNVTVTAKVGARLMGPPPTQEDMEAAFVDAGYEEVTSSTSDGTGATVANITVNGVSADGSAEASLQFIDDEQMKYDYFFTLTSTEEFVLTPGDFDTYQTSEHRQFDQALVTPLDE
ncbi:hypothetical protein [Demequina aurantiaca]|uniref:hypothetical protein n=1 Tax=Demequina aurantiaca TaxID=676200 RepID=UPI0007853250|nr:hypothetical protein [Demequina aurantiaca]